MSEWVEDRAYELMEEMLDDPKWVEKADEWCGLVEAESVLASLAHIDSSQVWAVLDREVHGAYSVAQDCLQRRKDSLLEFAREQAEKDWHYKQAEEQELLKRGYADDY